MLVLWLLAPHTHEARSRCWRHRLVMWLEDVGILVVPGDSLRYAYGRIEWCPWRWHGGWMMRLWPRQWARCCTLDCPHNLAPLGADPAHVAEWRTMHETLRLDVLAHGHGNPA